MTQSIKISAESVKEFQNNKNVVGITNNNLLPEPPALVCYDEKTGKTECFSRDTLRKLFGKMLSIDEQTCLILPLFETIFGEDERVTAFRDYWREKGNELMNFAYKD